MYWTAVHILEKFDCEKIKPALVNTLKHGSVGSKYWAIKMLQRCKAKEVEPLFLELLNSPEVLIKSAAEAVLKVFKDF